MEVQNHLWRRQRAAAAVEAEVVAPSRLVAEEEGEGVEVVAEELSLKQTPQVGVVVAAVEAV